MQVWLVRHGESEFNRDNRWQGQGPTPLAESGRQQTRRLRERLTGTDFSRVICSDLVRTRQTAEELGYEVEVEPAWREIDVGRWQGLLHEEVNELYADEVAAHARGEDLKVGGGESFAELLSRTTLALQNIFAQPADKPVLVVTHGAVIAILAAAAVGCADRKRRPLGKVENTSITILDDTGHLCVFNDSTHLGRPARAEATVRIAAAETAPEAPLSDAVHAALDAEVDARLEGAPSELHRYTRSLLGVAAKVRPPDIGNEVHFKGWGNKVICDAYNVRPGG